MDELSPELKDKLKKICLCKGISQATMKKAIKDGCSTLRDVQQATGAGTGPCSGRRCTPKILELLESKGQ